jgi:SPP1 family predicted phage head-tail adaptor
MLKDYFDKVVSVEKVTRVSNGFGGFTETWSKDFNVDCLIDFMAGKKQEIARQFQEDTTHILMADVGTEIKITHRINHNGDIYRILHVDEPFSKHSEIYLQKVGVDNAI